MKAFRFLHPSDLIQPVYARMVFITNILSFAFIFISLILAATLWAYFGWLSTNAVILGVALSYAGIIVLNQRYHQLGRLFFCLLPVGAAMFITLYLKIYLRPPSYLVYIDSRFFLLAMTVLPAVVFRLEERWYMIFAEGTILIALLGFDPIHQWFGVGYYAYGFMEPAYGYLNYVVALTYAILLLGVMVLRAVLERSQRRLEERNVMLQQQQEEIEAQRDALADSTAHLDAANVLIRQQQASLEKYNASLEEQVEQKSGDLRRANQELVQHNHELRQFSYTVSHNLRGPVARLLGLSEALQQAATPGEQDHMRSLIHESAQELDGILGDLTAIIDIRHGLFHHREPVVLQEEWDRALRLLQDQIKPAYDISADFTLCTTVPGIRPMIQSIVYNLLSNAIKYQDKRRPLRIRVRSYREESDSCVLEVADNGMGIDLDRHRDHLFRLYRRFHAHVSGKGLGLYLVRTQAEVMNGTVTVDSQPGQGTTFRLILPALPEGKF